MRFKLISRKCFDNEISVCNDEKKILEIFEKFVKDTKRTRSSWKSSLVFIFLQKLGTFSAYIILVLSLKFSKTIAQAIDIILTYNVILFGLSLFFIFDIKKVIKKQSTKPCLFKELLNLDCYSEILYLSVINKLEYAHKSDRQTVNNQKILCVVIFTLFALFLKPNLINTQTQILIGLVLISISFLFLFGFFYFLWMLDGINDLEFFCETLKNVINYKKGSSKASSYLPKETKLES